MNMETALTRNKSFTGEVQFDDRLFRKYSQAVDDYRPRIAILMQAIESLEGFAGAQRKELNIVHDRCDELELKLIEMGKANLNLYNQVLAAGKLISLRDSQIKNLTGDSSIKQCS